MDRGLREKKAFDAASVDSAAEIAAVAGACFAIAAFAQAFIALAFAEEQKRLEDCDCEDYDSEDFVSEDSISEKSYLETPSSPPSTLCPTTMPRPAKPPMTLKEAKRAAKKDGAPQFQLTASQMERADRLEAREEQRKKAIEKERQRRENKRKRDEKEEKERAVKRKMLEEGRIKVEDTWGKVTASQPRLNKFFVRNPTKPLVPSKRSIRDEVIVEENAENEDEGAGGDRQPQVQGAEGDQEERDNAPEKALTTSAKKTIPSTGSQGRVKEWLSTALPTQAPSASLPSLTGILHAPASGQRSPPPLQGVGHAVQSRPSTLKEQSKSQLNARQKQPLRLSQDAKARKDVPRSSKQNTADAPRRSPRTTQSQNRVPDGTASKQASISISDSQRATTGKLAGTGGEQKNQTLSSQDHFTDNAPRTVSGAFPAMRANEDEEDFTEGIDDETFLMLCATQEPMNDEIDAGNPSNAAESACSNPGAPTPSSAPDTDHTRGPSTSRSETHPPAAQEQEEMAPQVPTTIVNNESFSAEFAKFEDEELIALAEEAEASTTPVAVAAKQSSTLPPPPPPNPIATTSNTNQDQHQTRTSQKAMKSSPNRKTNGRESMKNRGHGRGRPSPNHDSRTSRVHTTKQTAPAPAPAPPRDDFLDAPGPSTQALMLELVAQAEAAAATTTKTKR
ncbi:hypothetical protein HRR83_007138 [Exophiala dermatitidis]|uniref:Uncharacterized protein n=1 Tax=Exophiala dermatitidis TaxID=5970 RepID=A0AAN6ET86_EXODE|nr:hypothetical protein HRR75_006147 [Exophiala dermatitidis]KAJ4511099.1 hypothetical protein HRR73_006430 [Exophiala dermatitidis]KAJ4511966.1 hypothetical protein HRR74_006702 [Exophiala dermatitidis]KAJ4545802.1 hypothetical protein HRR78_006078 [Exophiala dermatitidis]KAJ4550821.1 hypothetical protein HRR77_003179 [Exophiala dermatitidis]